MPMHGKQMTYRWGRPSTKIVKALYVQLYDLQIGTCCSHEWKACSKVLSATKHQMGKAFTKHMTGVTICLTTRNGRIVKTACCLKN
jgi:IS1 family transposase